MGGIYLCSPRKLSLPSLDIWNAILYLTVVGEGNGTLLQYFAWKIPWTEEPGRLQSMGSLGIGHDWATSISLFTFMYWRRKRSKDDSLSLHLLPSAWEYFSTPFPVLNLLTFFFPEKQKITTYYKMYFHDCDDECIFSNAYWLFVYILWISYEFHLPSFLSLVCFLYFLSNNFVCVRKW